MGGCAGQSKKPHNQRDLEAFKTISPGNGEKKGKAINNEVNIKDESSHHER